MVARLEPGGTGPGQWRRPPARWGDRHGRPSRGNSDRRPAHGHEIVPSLGETMRQAEVHEVALASGAEWIMDGAGE